jgi:hypothetical protein
MAQYSDALSSLEGRQLSSVEFVQDYVQLRFDGPRLTAITRPRIHVSGLTLEWGNRDFRNALCDRIGRLVQRAATIEQEGIRIEFDDGASIVISLDPADARAAEAAVLDDPPRPTVVW